jgi:hypothetical protein
VSTPEDKKFDFEKMTLSDDLAGSLEPIANGASDQVLPDREAEAEANIEDLPAEVDEEAEQDTSIAAEGPPVPAKSKYKDLLEKLKKAEPFNVLLALTVAALFIAILCCLVELGRYGFHISAKEAKVPLTISAPLDSIRNIS